MEVSAIFVARITFLVPLGAALKTSSCLWDGSAAKMGQTDIYGGEVFVSISIPGIESRTFIAVDGNTFSFCMSIFSINSISSCPG